MVDVCECAANWRIEMVRATTGEVLKVVVPTAFEFEMVFLEVGRGTITFNRHGVEPFSNSTDDSFFRMLEMYPKSVVIYFSRTAGGIATPDSIAPMFGGIVETFNGVTDGMVTLGFKEIHGYLDERLIRSDLIFTGVDQRSIAQDLVMYARGENVGGGSTDPIPGPGIELIGGQAGAGGVSRDRTYLGAERKNIGDALREFMAIINGPVYSVDHFRSTITDAWASQLIFRNTWLQPSPFPVIAWHHITDIPTFMMDGNETANLVDAFGEPDEDGTPLIVTYWPGSTFADMPRYDAAPTFENVSNALTLLDHAEGYHADHADLAGNLQIAFSGLDYGSAAGGTTLTIDDLRPGNEVSLDIRSPHWSIRGGYSVAGSTARPTIGRLSVSVGLEGPESVTIQIMEEQMSRLVIPNDLDIEMCEDC